MRSLQELFIMVSWIFMATEISVDFSNCKKKQQEQWQGLLMAF